MNKLAKCVAGSGRLALSVAFAFMLPPAAVLASTSQPQTCNALVSLANNLYLVNGVGKVLTQYTSDGTSKVAVAVAPDGAKVAYVTPDLSARTYEVVDTSRQQGTYPIYKIPKRDDPYGFVVHSTLESLSWSSNDVLTVINSAGKNYKYFLYRRIPRGFRPFSPLVVKPAMADACAMQSPGRELACIDAGGSVFLDGGVVSGRQVFSITGFEGNKPEESFTLGVGESANTHGTTPSYSVTIEGVVKDDVTLKITPPGGNWAETTVPSGHGTSSPGPYDSPLYGFFATIVNHATGLVRIDVIKSDSSDNIFDPALAWVPDDHGLVLIRRTDTQAFLYLIRPGRGEHRKDARDEGRGQWTLAAQAVIGAPEQIDSMRFATPSLLLLKDDLGNYSEVSVQIGRTHGADTLTLGTVTALPTTQNVELNGTGTQGTVLDWSCQQPRSRGIGGNWPTR